MDGNFDLIVIGAGMAGVVAVEKCAKKGWRVAIVDSLSYGGTCALRGCDPKKILRHGAEIIASARLMRGKGIDDAGLSINWNDLIKHKRDFTDPVPRSIEDNLIHSGVVTFHSAARFVDHEQVDIDGEVYRASHFLIATGAEPHPLDLPDSDYLIDSAEFMNLQALPSRILFLSGGFISFEFAHIAARAGSTPTIVDRGLRPLREFDPDLVELLVTDGVEAGIELRRSTTIREIERAGNTFRVTLEHPDGVETIDTDLIGVACGKVKNRGLAFLGFCWCPVIGHF